MQKILSLLCLLTIHVHVNAQEPLKTHLNPEGMVKPGTYSQVVVVNNGKLVITSGIVSQNIFGEIVGKDNLNTQVQTAFENLQIALKAAGANFSDVVKMNYYIVNYKPEQLADIRLIRSRFLPESNPPASTLVGVAALFHPDALIEIEAVAVIKK